MTKQYYVIDLTRCTGCQACSIACKDRAGLPDDLDWLRVEAAERGDYPVPAFYYRVIHCFHCSEPPCVDACPATAIFRHANEWVQIDASLCTGCGACLEACPFSAIVMGSEGVATKCDGCADEVGQGWGPTCVRACPMRALGYGPETHTLSGNRARDQEFQDHGTVPSVSYLRRPGR